MQITNQHMNLKFVLGPNPPPDDTNLGGLRTRIRGEHWWQRLCETYPDAKLQIKYLDGSDVGDQVTVGTLRRAVNEGRITFGIDDGTDSRKTHD